MLDNGHSRADRIRSDRLIRHWREQAERERRRTQMAAELPQRNDFNGMKRGFRGSIPLR